MFESRPTNASSPPAHICVSRFLPFKSLRFKIARPPGVFFLARNPHFRFRFMLDGWYVRLISQMPMSCSMPRSPSPLTPQESVAPNSPTLVAPATGSTLGKKCALLIPPRAIRRRTSLQLDADPSEATPADRTPADMPSPCHHRLVAASFPSHACAQGSCTWGNCAPAANDATGPL